MKYLNFTIPDKPIEYLIYYHLYKLIPKRKHINSTKGIHQELIQQFFHPERIQRFAETYHLDFIQYLEIFI